jgi:16S rRNA (guanine1516-N2)-methyltransferase
MKLFIDSLQVDLKQFSELEPVCGQIISTIADDFDGEFHLRESQLIFKENNGLELKINAKSELEYHKRYFFKNSLHKELLAKAIGIKKGKDKPKVLDCTGGTLKDSLLMYAFGIELIVCERNPVAASLISNAISQNRLNMKFINDSCLSETFDADVAYFDPMYSHKNEKSLPKKEMRIFREVVGEDLDSLEVAQILKKNYKRLVIKRSTKAPFLIDSPSMSFTGKSTRYDVYLS